MKIKRYTARTMREAMNIVRREHGDDAVILSTKDVANGVEVMAALDPEIEEYRQSIDDMPPAQNPGASMPQMPRHLQAYEATHRMTEPSQQNSGYAGFSEAEMNANVLANQGAMASHSATATAGFNREHQSSRDSRPQALPESSHSYARPRAQAHEEKEELHKMASEIQAMRALLENQMAGLAWGQLEHSEPAQIDLIKRLLSIGIGWDLCQKLVKTVNAKESGAWSALLNKIEQDISFGEKDILEVGGVYALVGPTGVGKTTTIAKIASRFVMRNHPNELALITTDSYKVGAQAQLKIFADLINVPVHVASTQDELYALLSSFATKKLVLIDTAGMSQKALQLSAQLTSGAQGNVPIKNYLVMSATSSLRVMQQVVEAFKPVVLSGCVLTKVDEAVSLGNILTILVEQTLPIAYVSNGQRVPEDIDMIRARDLIDQAIVLGQQNANVTDEQAFKMGIAKEISNAQ